MSYPVKLRIYDLSKGIIKSLSPYIIDKQIDGLWHTEILVYDKEYYFNNIDGINIIIKDSLSLNEYHPIIIDIGITYLSEYILQDYLDGINNRYIYSSYNLFTHNAFKNEN